VRVPIIGMGGIQTAEDAVEFLLCGAHAVAVASGLLAHPRAAEVITLGLARFLVEQGVGHVGDLVGRLEFPGAPDARPAASPVAPEGPRRDTESEEAVPVGAAGHGRVPAPLPGPAGVAADAAAGTQGR